MKKFISLALSVALVITGLCIPTTASAEDPVDDPDSNLESVFAEGENSLIVFVTGIGQSWSYLFDEKYLEEDAFETGTLQDYENYSKLLAKKDFIDDWNLFAINFGRTMENKDTRNALIKLIGSLLLSLFTRKNTAKDETIAQVIEGLFENNLIDDNGDTPANVVTPRYTMPISEYPPCEDGSENLGKGHFYGSIPCRDIAREALGENYEDYLYCFNYPAFSYPDKNISDLHEYIETILANNKVGAEDIVLVPMSMGASVVSGYLYQYPTKAENHVRRVVSVVGCWEGSKLITDLLTLQYADNSADLFYNGIIGDLVGAPWGYLVNWVLRLFSKTSLRDFIDQALAILGDKLLLNTPSLLCLIPPEDYDTIRPLIKKEKVVALTDKYYEAQSTLQPRLAALDEQNIPVYFISGYGFAYGEITSDYHVFGFMKHAATINSDEIIDISSTAPGTSFVSPNEQFEDGIRLSPDKTIDAGTAYYPDHCWYFYKQKHELEQNNTALKLAIELALGNITSVADCDSEDDALYFPQFNGARNLKELTRDYLPTYLEWAQSHTPTDTQQALYEEVLAMMDNTANNYEEDNVLIDEFYDMLVEIGLKAPRTAKKESLFEKFMRQTNDLIASTTGSKGYLDFGIKG
ncbi:MAG TPA: alpha/beta hydrolase [Clostridiales bacterium]|nr:alpha/beta hydrolase [Clostridiales bacterium]